MNAMSDDTYSFLDVADYTETSLAYQSFHPINQFLATAEIMPFNTTVHNLPALQAAALAGSG